MAEFGKGQEISRHIQITDNIKVSTLKTTDKIRLLLSRVATDDASELDAASKVNRDKLSKLAALSGFLEEAIHQMESRKENSVTVLLPRDFEPFMADVMDKQKGLGRFYDFKISTVNAPYGIDYKFPVKITRNVERNKRRY